MNTEALQTQLTEAKAEAEMWRQRACKFEEISILGTPEVQETVNANQRMRDQIQSLLRQGKEQQVRHAADLQSQRNRLRKETERLNQKCDSLEKQRDAFALAQLRPANASAALPGFIVEVRIIPN